MRVISILFYLFIYIIFLFTSKKIYYSPNFVDYDFVLCMLFILYFLGINDLIRSILRRPTTIGRQSIDRTCTHDKSCAPLCVSFASSRIDSFRSSSSFCGFPGAIDRSVYHFSNCEAVLKLSDRQLRYNNSMALYIRSEI